MGTLRILHHVHIVVAALFFFIGSLQAPAIGQPSADAVKQIEERVERLKVRLDAATSIAQNTTSLAQNIATYMQVILAATAVFSIVNFVGTRKIVKDAEKELEALRTVIREKYPELADLHRSMTDVLNGLGSNFSPSFEWVVAYNELSSERRQQILIEEMKFAGLEVFELGRIELYKPILLKVYRGLGRFYTAKYEAAGNWRERSDWDRGGIYLRTAERLAGKSSAVLSDVGTHLLVPDTVSYWKKQPARDRGEERMLADLRSSAERTFLDSLELNPDEASSLYGLGWIASRRGDFGDAVRYYERITKIVNWPDEEARFRFVGNAYYNCACFKWLDANRTHAGQGVLADLEHSKEVARQRDRLDIWRKEFKEDEDLATFRDQFPNETARLLG